MIHKTYEYIGSLSREQRLIAKMGPGTEVSKNLATLDIESLQSKASTLSELVKLINANSVSRTERVKRAKQAAEIAGKATEAQMAIGKKKLVLEASRQIMQNAIDESKAEFNSDTVKKTKKTFLKTEQTQIEESQKELEEIESNLEKLEKKKVETKKAEAEKKVESSKWKWGRLLAYGGAALAGGAAARWVWEHTIGWMWDNTVGSKEKPGFMRKLTSVIVSIGGSIGGYMGLQWLSNKFNLNLFSKGKELWDKYGMDKSKYYAGLALYKVGKIDEARKIWGEGADKIIADLEEEERNKPKAETRVDKNGIEWMRAKDALPNYQRAIDVALFPFKQFFRENQEGLVVIAGATLVISKEVRHAVLNIGKTGAKGIMALLKFFGEKVKNHPILSALSFTAFLYGASKSKDMWIPKDPSNLQAFASGTLSSAGTKIQETNSAMLAKIAPEDWTLLAGLAAGNSEAMSELQTKTGELFDFMTKNILERVALSKPELIQQKNEAGLSTFVGFLEGIKNQYPELQTKFDIIKTYVNDIQYPLTMENINDLQKLTKDFDVLIEKEGGIYVYRIKDEYGVWHTTSLCINPSIPIKEQAAYARTFIKDKNNARESLNQSTVPIDQAREWAQYIFFEGAKTDEEAAQKLETELNSGSTIIVRSGIAYLCTVSHGALKKYAIGPYEFTVKPLWTSLNGDFSCTEMALDYTEGLLPVFMLGTASAISRFRFGEIFKGKVLWKTFTYPITGTVRTYKLATKSILIPMYHNVMSGDPLFRGVLQDPKNIIRSGTLERMSRWKGFIQRKFLPGKVIREIGFINRRISLLHEAKKLIGLSRYNLNDTKYLDAAHTVLTRSEMGKTGKAVPHVSELAGENGMKLVDDEIARLTAKKAGLRSGASGADAASHAPRAVPPSGASSVAESADDVAKAIKAALNGGPDDIVKLLKKGRTLSEIFKQANTADDYARLAKALKILDPAERIEHLSKLCTSSGVNALKHFKLADNLDEIVKIVAKIGDDGIRSARIRELITIHGMTKDQLIKAGASSDEVFRIAKALGSGDEASRAAAAAAATAAASHGIPPPIPTGSDDVVLTARQSIKNIVKLRNHAPTQLVLRQNGEEAAKLIQIAHKANGVTGAKRAARYMLSFTDDIDKARRSAMLAPEMLQLVAKGEAGNPAAIARFLGGIQIKTGTAVTGEMLAKAAKTMTRWQKAGTGMRTLYAAGAVLEAGALVFDIYQYQQAKAELAKQKVVLDKALTEAGLTSDDNGKYSGCGVAINIKDVEDTNVDEYLARSVAGGAGLAVTLFAPSMCLGPAGLVVAGAIITAHMTIGLVADEIEKNKHQKFLEKAPHWLLAMLGTQTFIRQSYHQTIREYARDDSEDSWKHSFGNQSMMTNRRFNPNPSKQSYEKQTEKERLDLYRLRKKLIQSMSYRAISINYPDLLIELPGMNNEGPTKYAGLQSFLDPKGEFLKSDGDFDRIVLPYVLMRLHAATINEGISFNKTKDLDITDNIGGFFDGKWLGREIPTVSDYELEKTVEEAMLFYIQHIKERRYRGQLDKIKHMIEQEGTRLDGISTLTPIQRKEETLLYGRALRTVLTEEMEENRDISYVLNQDPATLPVYPNGKTLVEHLIQERYQAVSNATDSTSAKTAKEGWSLTPASEVMDIDRFAGRYIRPQFKELDKKWLKANSPGKGDPFSFEELNIMGKTDEDFRKEFESKMAPLIDVANGIRTGIRTDEDLKQFVEKMGPKIDFYVKFHSHEYYYRRYLDKWRPGSNIKIEEGSQLIPVLREWRNSGYPRLISNEFFGGWVDNVKNRKAIYPQNQLRIANSKIRMNQAIKNIMNMDKIPGMSLMNDVKGTHLYSYDGYIEMMQQLVKKAKSEKINIPIPFESIYEKNTNRGSRLFDVNDSKNRLYKRWNYADRTTNKYAQVDANEIKPPRILDLKKFIDMDKKKPDTQNSRYTRYPSDKLPEDSSSFYVDELGRPQQIGRFVNYRHKNETVALTPYELEKMLSELGVLPQAPGQNFIIQNRQCATRKSENDGFAALREHLVKSNVLVIANPELIKYEIEPRKIYRRSQ